MNSQDDEKLSDGVRSEIGLRRDKAMEFRANMQSKRMVSVPNFTEQEMENAVDNFFKEDEFTQKTWTRLFVENVLSKYNWYFPAKNLRNPPSLSKSYAYYEHVILPRKIAGGETAKHVLRRADPGETDVDTELYSLLRTPSSSLIEWGLGVDQYFISLRIMALVLFIAGLIHLPNLIFYRSGEYCSADKSGISISLKGSALCTETEWVVCTDCFQSKWLSLEEQARFADATNPITNEAVTLIQRFACKGGRLPQGIVNWACFFFLVIAMYLIHIYLSAREIRFDEDKITSSDFTIVVQDPPADAYDPDEWHAFFSQFAAKQVTAITIALNNETLLRKLIDRRRHRQNLKLMLPKGTNMNDVDELHIAVAQLVRDRIQEGKSWLTSLLDVTILPILRIFNMFLPPETLLEKSLTLTDEIKELTKNDYTVTKVFVTYETEEGQRAAMESLSVGKLVVLMNQTSMLPPSALFRGKVLTVTETAEANAIRWLDLSASNMRILIMRIITLLSTGGVLGICGLVVYRVRYGFGTTLAAPLVSVFNFLIPLIVKIFMLFEPHHTEGNFQASLYTKITMFRWVNTALLAKLVTPWTSTVGPNRSDILPSINSVMWAEFWITPIIRLLDLWGNFQKHYLAPRARTQGRMNTYFQGTTYNLGERYTELTKVLFLCFFYSALYPASFFFGTAILLIQYYTDKYLLLRVWSNNANLGSEVARFSRKYFFSGALLAYCVISAYAWAGFPYDNLCIDENYADGGANGTYTNVVFRNTTRRESVEVKPEDAYKFCRQSFTGFDGLLFPPTSRIQSATKQWMQNSQETLTDLYGWTSVVAVTVYVLVYFGTAIFNALLSWIQGVYEPQGQEQHIDFSSDYDLIGYVPQIKLPGFFFPLIACDVDGIDKSLLGWTDRGHTYDYHNLIFDVEWEGMPRQKKDESFVTNNRQREIISSIGQDPNQRKRRHVFSTINHYPPDWMKKIKNMKKSES